MGKRKKGPTAPKAILPTKPQAVRNERPNGGRREPKHNPQTSGSKAA